MKTFLSHIREKLRSSFWFVPSLCGLTAIALAEGLLVIDGSVDDDIAASFSELAKASPDGVRSLLSTIGTSVLTLAGLTFSATLVALTLTSGQFGPRLLRNFIRSRTNQLTLGILLGTFIYCLIVLRRVSDEFIPHLSSLGGFILALGGLAAFIIFVHSLVVSMQAEHVVAEVHRELGQALEKAFPDSLPTSEEERKAEKEKNEWEEIEEESRVTAIKAGYLQAIDVPTLVRRATELDVRFRVVRRPGHFIQTGESLVAFSSGVELDEENSEGILDCFLIGKTRTAEQDFEFSVRQLVEVALRALSPGINDPFTAIACIDFLSEALAKVSRRKLPQRVFRDDDGNPRVATRPASFQSMLNTAFLQIRQAGVNKPDIMISLLDGLDGIAVSASTSEQRETLVRHAEIVAADGLKNTPNDFDRECIEERLEQVRKRCDAS